MFQILRTETQVRFGVSTYKRTRKRNRNSEKRIVESGRVTKEFPFTTVRQATEFGKSFGW